MLELRRKRAIARYRGPAVGQHFHVRAPEIDHRLDGKEHALLEYDAFPLPPDVHDVRLVMKEAPKAVAAEVAHHAHMLGFNEGLDRGADIAGGYARTDRGDAAHHRFVGDIDQPLGAARDPADRVHATRIPVPAVEDQGYVDIDDVTFLEWLFVGDAVADDVVDRGADRLAIAAIHQ